MPSEAGLRSVGEGAVCLKNEGGRIPRTGDDCGRRSFGKVRVSYQTWCGNFQGRLIRRREDHFSGGDWRCAER